MNVRSLAKTMASQPFKKMVTQLLVSVSIFTLVFSWPSLSLTSPRMYYEKLYYFSWNCMKLFSIAMNKNCIFLICNGILVLVAKTSVVVPSPSTSYPNDVLLLQKRIGDGDGLQIRNQSEPVFEKHVMLEESGAAEKEEEEEEMKWNEEDEAFECWNEGAEEVCISIDESDEEGRHEDVANDERETENCLHFDGERQLYAEEEEEEIEELSTEELNQKFEDFIRRMKEGFRINEARQQQRQLVMVN